MSFDADEPMLRETLDRFVLFPIRMMMSGRCTRNTPPASGPRRKSISTKTRRTGMN